MSQAPIEVFDPVSIAERLNLKHIEQLRDDNTAVWDRADNLRKRICFSGKDPKAQSYNLSGYRVR